MTLRICQGCTTAFAVGLDVCPQCGSADHYEQGSRDDMPKSTVHGGASNADEEYAVDTDTQGPSNPDDENDDAELEADETNDVDEASEANEAGEEDDGTWLGSNSSTSGDKPAKSASKSGTVVPSPAPTTGSRSGKAGGQSNSSALSTGGSTRGTTSGQSSKK